MAKKVVAVAAVVVGKVTVPAVEEEVVADERRQ